MSDDRKISKANLYILMFCMLIAGAANTLVLKYMDDTEVGRPNPKDPSKTMVFNHPYF